MEDSKGILRPNPGGSDLNPATRSLRKLLPVLVMLVVGGVWQVGSGRLQAAQYRRRLEEKAAVVAALLDKSPELPRTRELLRALVAATSGGEQPLEAFIVAGRENVRSSARSEEDGRDWSAIRRRVAAAWRGAKRVPFPLFRDPAAPQKQTGLLYLVAPRAPVPSPVGAVAAGLMAGMLCALALRRAPQPAPSARTLGTEVALPLVLEIPAMALEVVIEVPPAEVVAPTEHPAEETPTLVFDERAPDLAVGAPAAAVPPAEEAPTELLEAPAAAKEPSGNAAGDRRRHARFACGFRVRYRFARGDDLVHGWGEMDALNVSVGGLMVRLEHDLAGNELLHLEAQLPDGPLSAPARVAWYLPEESLAGLEFLNLPDEDCARLFAALDPALCA